jgi:hypothetical protein
MLMPTIEHGSQVQVMPRYQPGSMRIVLLLRYELAQLQWRKILPRNPLAFVASAGPSIGGNGSLHSCRAIDCGCRGAHDHQLPKAASDNDLPGVPTVVSKGGLFTLARIKGE